MISPLCFIPSCVVLYEPFGPLPLFDVLSVMYPNYTIWRCRLQLSNNNGQCGYLPLLTSFPILKEHQDCSSTLFVSHPRRPNESVSPARRRRLKTKAGYLSSPTPLHSHSPTISYPPHIVVNFPKAPAGGEKDHQYVRNIKGVSDPIFRLCD